MIVNLFSGRSLRLPILIAWLIAGALRGQPFRVDHIGVAQGLTQGSVYHILKDSRGFMWFGTQDGLNRYDGHSFRTFRPNTRHAGTGQNSPLMAAGAIRGVNIFGIVETPDGNLWVGTEEGLNRYDRQHDHFDCLKFRDPVTRQYVSSRTLPFYADAHELLYLSDAEGLVSMRWQTGEKRVLNPYLKPAHEYDLQSSTVRTRAGDVWLHAAKGVIRYNIRERRVHLYFGEGVTNEAGPLQAIFSFYIDKAGIAWLGSASALIRFDHKTCQYKTYQLAPNQPLSPVYSIDEDAYGTLWLGTQANGLLYFDRRGGRFGNVAHFTNNAQLLRNHSISKVYVDDQNTVWANSDPDGLARIVSNSFLFGGMMKSWSAPEPGRESAQVLSNYSVRAFLEESPRRIWVATEKGINVFDPESQQIVGRHLARFERGTLPLHSFVRSLYRDWLGTIWVGVVGGVMRYEPATQSFLSLRFPSTLNSLVAANYVRNMVAVDSTTLLMATEDGILALNTKTATWAQQPMMRHQNLFCFYFDQKVRQLWVGSYLHGVSVYQLPPAGGRGVWRLLMTGLKGATILHFRNEPARQTVWVSTDRGLAAINRRTGRIRFFGEEQGLANSFVYGSLPDDKGAIWVSTNRGIARLDPTLKQFTNFKLTDGLQAYEFNGNAFLQASNGELFFGGVDGFNCFRPQNYRTSRFNPKVHLYNFKVNEEPYKPDSQYVGEVSTIRLNYAQNTISLEFAALDYLSNGANTYQYQLTGYDEDWVQAGERNYARYPNLPAGHYTFQVKAANKDNHWSHHIRQVAIDIRPPYWQTVPFLVLLVGALAGFVFWYINQREAQIRTKEVERLKLAYEIQEQTKRSIARDLHDEIGTRLATLKLYTAQLVKYTPESTNVRSIKTNMFGLINDTISDVRTLLRKLDPRTLDQHGYLAAVEELFDRINATGSVQLRLVVVQAPARLSRNTALMLYRITQELVNNSLKHARAGQIELLVRAQTQALVLNYSDDGRGFVYDSGGRGLGIGNIESRVAILDGKILWQTQPGQGTRALIEIPLRGVESDPVPPSPAARSSVSG